MGGATFVWVFIFLAFNSRMNQTENYYNTYATLMLFIIFFSCQIQKYRYYKVMAVADWCFE
jgi:hypothetical protein